MTKESNQSGIGRECCQWEAWTAARIFWSLEIKIPVREFRANTQHARHTMSPVPTGHFSICVGLKIRHFGLQRPIFGLVRLKLAFHYLPGYVGTSEETGGT